MERMITEDLRSFTSHKRGGGGGVIAIRDDDSRDEEDINWDLADIGSLSADVRRQSKSRNQQNHQLKAERRASRGGGRQYDGVHLDHVTSHIQRRLRREKRRKERLKQRELKRMQRQERRKHSKHKKVHRHNEPTPSKDELTPHEVNRKIVDGNNMPKGMSKDDLTNDRWAQHLTEDGIVYDDIIMGEPHHLRQRRETQSQLGDVTSSRSRVRRAATAELDRLWDDAVIPYEIDSNFSGKLTSTTA